MTALCTMTLEVYYRHLPLYGDQSDGDSEMAEANTQKKAARSGIKRPDDKQTGE